MERIRASSRRRLEETRRGLRPVSYSMILYTMGPKVSSLMISMASTRSPEAMRAES